MWGGTNPTLPHFKSHSHGFSKPILWPVGSTRLTIRVCPNRSISRRAKIYIYILRNKKLSRKKPQQFSWLQSAIFDFGQFLVPRKLSSFSKCSSPLSVREEYTELPVVDAARSATSETVSQWGFDHPQTKNFKPKALFLVRTDYLLSSPTWRVGNYSLVL